MRGKLPDIDYGFSQRVASEHEIRRAAKLAAQMSTGPSRIMKGQMHESCIPAERIEAARPAPIAGVRSRHERMQHDHGRCGFVDAKQHRARAAIGRELADRV